jgi:nucleotide-binding universal stress UspA family protein
MSREEPQLVFGDDGSAAADVVWLWINCHAWPGWRLTVVTAQPPPLGPPVGAERGSAHPWEPPDPRQLPAGNEHTHVESLMAEADPRLVLDSFKDAALVAIGPRGRGRLKQLHLGSTAEWLVSGHRPVAPVIVVRSARRIWRVLLCVDGSAHARRAVETLVALPWIRDAQLTILGVSDGHSNTERGVEEAAGILEDGTVGVLSTRLPSVVPHRGRSDVRSTILDAIADERPDLVAMGNRGAGGLRRTVLGSTASAVIQHAPCSVLVARAHDSEHAD